MDIVTSALVLANDEASTEASKLSPFVFGASAFIGLVILLVLTLMIKVGD